MSTTATMAPRRPGTLKYELLLLLMAMIWGLAFVAQQIGMAKGLGPMTFTALRFALGVLVLMPIILWRRRSPAAGGGAGRLPLKASLAAGTFLFAAAGLQQIGLQYTSSANAGFITALYMLFVPLIGRLFGQRPQRGLWLGITVCLVGFYLLSFDGKVVVSRGDLLVLGSAVLWACQILVIEHVAVRGDPLRIAALQFAACAVLSAVVSLLFERDTFAHIPAAAGAVAYAGIMSVGIGFTLQVICQSRTPAAPAAVIMSLEAVFAAIAGYLVLGQLLTMRAMLGCGLIFCGVLVVQLAPMWRGRGVAHALPRPGSPPPAEGERRSRRVSGSVAAGP